MTFTTAERVFITIYYCFLGTFGLAANIALLVVLLKSNQYRRRPSTYYLYSVLAACIISCLYEIPYYIFSIMADLPALQGNAYNTECRISVFLTYGIAEIKIFLLVGLSFDRYLAVSIPFTYASHATKIKVGLVNVILWLSGIILTIPVSAMGKSVQYMGYVGTACGVHWDLMGKGAMASLIIIGFVLPCAMTVISNIKVFFAARRQRKNISCELKKFKKRETHQDDIIVKRANKVVQSTSQNESVNSSIRKNSIKLTKEVGGHLLFDSQNNGENRKEIVEMSSKSHATTASGYAHLSDISDSGTSCANRTNGTNDISVTNEMNETSDTIGTSGTTNISGISTIGSYKERQASIVSLSVENGRINRKKERRKLDSLRLNTDPVFRNTDWSLIVSTLMLVAAFFITWSPFAISRIYEAFTKVLGEKATLYTTMPTLLDIVLNPLIIFLTRKSLREKAFKIFVANNKSRK